MAVTVVLATFRGRPLGIGLDRGEWFAFIGAPALVLPGRHATLADAIAELDAEVDRFDMLAEEAELQQSGRGRYQMRRTWSLKPRR